MEGCSQNCCQSCMSVWCHHHQEDRWHHGKRKSKTETPSTTSSEHSACTQTHDNDIECDDVNTDLPKATKRYPTDGQRHPMPSPSQSREQKGLPQSQYYTTEELHSLSDDEILARLPKAKIKDNNAKRILKCQYESIPKCTSIVTTETQGFCNKHFCELLRTGLLRECIPIPVPERPRIGKKEKHITSAQRREQKKSVSHLPGAGVRDRQYRTEDDHFMPPVPDLPSSIPRVDTSNSSGSSNPSSPREERNVRPWQQDKTTKHDRAPRSRKHSRKRQDKTRHSSRNDDIVESGEDTNELSTAASENQTRRNPSAKICIGPGCYEVALAGNLCYKCSDVLMRNIGKRSAKKPSTNTPSSGQQHVTQPPLPVHYGNHQQDNQARHNTNVRLPTHGCNNYRCSECDRPATLPRHREIIHPDYQPVRTRRRSKTPPRRNGQKDDRRDPEQYRFDHPQYERSKHQVPPEYLEGQSRRRDVQARHHNDHIPHNYYDHEMHRYPYNDQTRHRHHENHAGHRHHYDRHPGREEYFSLELDETAGPSSILNGATSMSVEDNSATELSFAQSVTPYSKRREACRSHPCPNWGNSACQGYCNECYTNIN